MEVMEEAEGSGEGRGHTGPDGYTGSFVSWLIIHFNI